MVSKIKKLAALVLTVLLAFCLVSPAQAGPVMQRIQKSGKLRVGMDPTFPPMEYKDPKGKVVGFDVDLARMIAGGLGAKLVIVEMAFKNLLPSLKKGKLDIVISGTTITPERNRRYVFVGPYLISGQTILIKNTMPESVRGAPDLNRSDYRISAAMHTTAAQAVRNMIPMAKFMAAKNENKALELLLQGKVDAMVADLTFSSVAYSHNRDKLVHLSRPFTYEPSGMAIAPGDPHLENWLVNFLMLMRGTGRLDALGQRWFKDTVLRKRIP